MATRTTNYGLYKPDPTDPFGDFRSEHNANMEIIDQHLGGGGGSSVVWNQIQQSGTKIAEISINGVSTDVFAPDGGGGGGGGDSFFHLYVMNGGSRNRLSENISHVIT